ncbi:MAG: Fic family protein [Terriglobus sp.]
MHALETPNRIEPARLEVASAALADALAEVSAEGMMLGRSLAPLTAANLADLVRVMNTYYSNLIEGHNTRPRDIERALQGQFAPDEATRNLQLEAAAHVRVQEAIDRQFLAGTLPAATSADFLKWVHREFYRGASEKMLRMEGGGREFVMQPGEWRSRPEHDNAVGRHIPPSSQHVAAFMAHFERRYSLEGAGTATRIMAMAAAHHRLNYIHPFPDGNGRVSRLMSHAMAQQAGIGAHGLWSISRGLARGLDSRLEYKQHMDAADAQRFTDTDGRGNLSQRALEEFTLWFVRVSLDQVRYMSSLFDLGKFRERIARFVERSTTLKPESSYLLQEALTRGEFQRGEIMRLTGLPERSARRVLSDLTGAGLLASQTPLGPLSLRFPNDVLEDFFPKLYPHT